MKAFIAWEGPSPITGEPMVLILTGLSANTKTGPMYQAWLLLRNMTPFEALKSGADRGICGDCVHRSGERRTCYVSMFNGPIGIWRKFVQGFYPTLSVDQAAEVLGGQSVRVTAYGDPAFVPFDVWDGLLAKAAGWAGYTHQWRTCDPRFRALLMASVETLEEMAEAHAQGWRTFRARPLDAPLTKAEFGCPASDEGGHRATCLTCQLCRGQASPAKSVSILLHGKVAAPRPGPRSRYDALRTEIVNTGSGVFHGQPSEGLSCTPGPLAVLPPPRRSRDGARQAYCQGHCSFLDRASDPCGGATMSRSDALGTILRGAGLVRTVRRRAAQPPATPALPAMAGTACTVHLFEPARGGRRCRWCHARPDGRVSTRSPELGRVRTVPSEAVEQRAIIDLLVAAGCRYGARADQETDIYVLGTKRPRNLPRAGHATHQTPGIPDLFSFLPLQPKLARPMPAPRFVWIEVKALDGGPSPAQLRFADRAVVRGVPYLIGGAAVVQTFLEQHGFLKERS